MNIEFSKEELTAIAQNDYSIFDHELSAYELKAAITAIVTELTSSEPITALKEQISILEEEKEQYKNRYQAVKKGRFEKIEQLTALRNENQELRDTIFYREQALEEWQKKAGDLEKEKAALQIENDKKTNTIFYRELALDEAAKKRDELETKNRQLCYDLAGERLMVRNLKEKLNTKS